jgi:hypothetical protein
MSRADIVRRHERVGRITPGVGLSDPIERRIERSLLQRSVLGMEKAGVTAGVPRRQLPEPVIDVQSIHARHELIRELDGEKHDALMEELRWAVDKNRPCPWGRRRRDCRVELGVEPQDDQWTGSGRRPITRR